ncbi:hypothetical protein [Corticimicrobacter populi]|uniref:DNA binding HTH domain-containing protein n=1 Tax=Corticimicrobacter populi TaxID=2175229 RepID=A0A2V1JYP7_9BURK|nr:hypothetical protein [Corticimicrobacter populi]PWF23899.1 hypothetical protein DD235_06085 [Corticimicrobacter populi]
MTYTLDCAVLSLPTQTVSTQRWLARMQPALVRSRLHLLDWHSMEDAAGMLPSLGMTLRRYDICVLPIERNSLAWFRTALAGAAQIQGIRFETPLLGLMHQVCAVAVRDLVHLGLDDYLYRQDDPDAFRARMLTLVARHGRQRLKGPEIVLNGLLDERQVVDGSGLCPAGIMESPGRYVVGSPRPWQRQPTSVSAGSISGDESFKQAKRRVTDRFEQAYLHDLLHRARGNITHASRIARKHRRSLWALMSKHQIRAEPYRVDITP